MASSHDADPTTSTRTPAPRCAGLSTISIAALLAFGVGCGNSPTLTSDAGSGSDSGERSGADAAVRPDAAGTDAGAGIDAGSVVPEVPECFAGTVETGLPERVIFRSATTSFNQRWFVALQDGRIWVKPNTDAGRPPGEWQMLGTGLPSGGGLTRFAPPTEIAEISADGTWLHALSTDDVFYRGTNFEGDVLSSFTWSDTWGHPAATGPGMRSEWPTTHGWSVSDAQRAGVDRYEDRLGTSHDVGNGVAHIYRMGPDGRRIFYNDWWLPADWSRQICTPDRGTFFSENISVSASTIFLIGARGEMYTRIYDFDTSGEDDLLEYSYLITSASGQTRALPAEDWRLQPAITDGLITSRITIFQDGQGNAARMLRVEGVRDGHTGFFYKHIFDDGWSFEETGLEVCGPFLNAPGREPPATVAPNDYALEGTLSVDRVFGTDVSVGIEILDFNMVCSPARAHILVGGSPVTVGGVPLEFPFHHVHSLILEQRPTEFWLSGAPAVIRAALILPPEIASIDDPTARSTLMALFEDRRGINLKGTATLSQLTLDEMTWLDPVLGVVPGSEKADPGNAIQLRATTR